MIKISNFDKYYYKNEARELHVLNNISLELGQTGFVFILGPSGSGKTTLLNCLAGLDKANGTISFDDETFDIKKPQSLDLFRLQHIGCIFQNYLIVEDETVEKNLKIALDAIGVKSAKEQKERIEYCLGLVGLKKVIHKKCRNLSGGQKQRVAIARALVKNSKVIIADEPTGNIDSTNTKEVMDILKDISKTALIIMVTHEEHLAYYYGDRIIKFEDGKILADLTDFERIDSFDDSTKKIYLENLAKVEGMVEGISLYRDDNSKDEEITLIVQNNSLYIKTNYKIVDTRNAHISILDQNEVKKEESKILYNQFEDVYAKPKFLQFFFEGFRSFFRKEKGKIINIIIYILLGFFMASATTALAKSIDQKATTGYLDQNVYVLNDSNNSLDNGGVVKHQISEEEAALLRADGKELFPIGASRNFAFSYHPFYMLNNSYTHNGYVYYYNNENLLYGRFVKKNGEILVTKALADIIIDKLGLDGDYNKFLELDLSDYSSYSSYSPRIVGIVEGWSPKIIINDLYYYAFFSEQLSNYYNPDHPVYQYFYIDKSLVEVAAGGKFPESHDEVLVSSNTGFIVGDEFLGYKVVGIIANYTGSDGIIVNTLMDFYQYQEEQYAYRGKATTLQNGVDEISYADYVSGSISRLALLKKLYTILTFVILYAVVILYTYFSSKISLGRQTREVGIYRCLGISKKTIVSRSRGYHLAHALTSGLVGYLIYVAGYYFIMNKYQVIAGDIPRGTGLFLVAGAFVLILINVIISSLPYHFLLRKTPSQIISKFDI